MDTTTRPSPPPRLLLLDVLRGVAILGTFAMNVSLFDQSPHGDDGWAGQLRLLFVSGNFLAMLAMMFGVGLAVQHRAVMASGGRWPGRHPWRAVLLLVEGTLHVLLVFAWDVLMGYALVALVVIWLLGRSERVRSVVMWTALGVHLTIMTAVSAVVLLMPAEDATSGRETAERNDPYTEVFVHGSYAEQVAYRAEHFLSTRGEVLITLPMVLFLFLFGVRLYRAGAFDDDAVGRRIRGRLLVWGLGLGLPLNVLALYAEVPGGRYVFPMVLTLGYVGLVGWLLDRARGVGPVTVSLRAVGRTALSCYVLQNVLGSWIFYAWGFGLAARADSHSWHLAVWAVVSLTLVGGALAWRSRFSHGPLEMVGARVLALIPERPARAPKA